MLQGNILVCYAAFVYFISIYLAVLKCVVRYFKILKENESSLAYTDIFVSLLWSLYP